MVGWSVGRSVGRLVGWFVMVGCGWLWLVVVGCGWLWLVIVGCGWLWLVIVGYGWLWLVMVGYGWLVVLVTWCPIGFGVGWSSGLAASPASPAWLGPRAAYWLSFSRVHLGLGRFEVGFGSFRSVWG